MKLGGLTKAAVAGFALALAACGQNNQSANEPAAPAAAPEAYSWGAVPPSTVQAGPPATMNLSGGYAYAIMANTAVAAGDTVNANLTVSGPAGRWVRVVLGRHCEADTGDENTPVNVELNGQVQPVAVSHTFQQPYSCIRLSLVSMDSQPLALTVGDLTVTKGPAAAGELRGSGG
jgi:hypothetical protein